MPRLPRSLSSNSPLPWVTPAVILLFSITIVPTVFLFFTSFHAWELGYPWEERVWLGLQNYATIFTNREFLHAILVTAVYTAVSVKLEFVLGFAIALYLSQERLRLRSLMIGALIIPMTVTPSIAGLIWRLYFNPNYGIVNYFLRTLLGLSPNWYGYHLALTSVILVDVWQWTPFVALILLAGLSALPRSPVEAAMVDGASRWQVLWHVTIPLLKPILLIALLLRTMDALKMFDVVFALTGGGPADATELLSMHVYRTGFYSTGMVGLASAMAVVLLVIITVLSQLYIRLLGGGKEGE
ncbi:MAG: carbohydrate ABC transporter permease [Betaproteobacteria bacterium]